MRKLGMLGASVLLMMVAPAIAAENLKDEVDKIGSQYMQFFNKKDAAGITSLYTKDYLRVNQGGVVADNTKLYEGTFKAGFDRLETKAIDCPSADDLRLIRRFEKGGSGSSGLEFKRPAADAASGGLRWLYA